MNYWLLSDTHFSHRKLDEWGGRLGEWEKSLWDGISRVPKEDTLIHLGDICIGDDVEVHSKLRAATQSKLILVRGNHDKKSINWYSEHGWDFVSDGLHLEFMGHVLLLTHRPMHPDMWRFSKNIHGHTHGNNHRAEEYETWYSKDYHIDISPEVVGYTPLRLDTLLKKYRP